MSKQLYLEALELLRQRVQAKVRGLKSRKR